MPAIFSNKVYLYPLIGAFQGFVIYGLVENVADGAPLFANAALLFAVLAPNLYYLSLPQAARALWAVGLSLGLAALFAGLTYVMGTNSLPPDLDMAFTAPGWIISIGLCLIALPFFQARGDTAEERTRYEVLHGFAWHNVFAIVLSWVFVGAVWLMLFLLAALFDLINISVLEDLLKEAAFALPLTFGTFGAGLAVTLAVPRVVEATHALAFALLRLLAVPFAAGAILFLALLPVTGLEPLWDTRSAASLLLAIVAAAVLLFNAVLQDAPGAPDYPRLPLHLVIVQLIVLPAFALLAGYAMWLRVDQYGLSPDRIYGLAVAAVALLASTAYALVLLASRFTGWNGLRQTNIYLLAPVALVAFVLITPFGNPARISALHQADRLRSGAVAADDFDFGTLKFNWGKPGQAVLESLRTDTSLPNRETVNARLEILDSSKTYHEWAGQVGLAGRRAIPNEAWRAADTQPFMVRPKGTPLPDDLWPTLQARENYDVNQCFDQPEIACAFIVADIYPGDKQEVVLAIRQGGGHGLQLHAYRHFADEGWHKFHMQNIWREGAEAIDPAWLAIEEGTFTLTTPDFNLLELGGGITVMTPENALNHPFKRAPVPVPKRPAAD